MRCLAVLILCLSTYPGFSFSSAQDTMIQRGIYITHEELQFEMWIPKGLHRSKSDRGDDVFHFTGTSRGARRLHIGNTSASNLDQFVEYGKLLFKTMSKGHTLKIFKDEKGGTRPAVIMLAQKLNLEDDKKVAEIISAGIDIGDSTVVEVTMYLIKGESERALAQARWMLRTFKFTGEFGLDPHLQRRRVHKETGLSFRPPRTFKEKPLKEGDVHVFAAEDTRTGARMIIEKADATSIKDALDAQTRNFKRVWRARQFPHPGGCKPFGSFYASRDNSKGRCVLVAEFKGGHFFTIRTDGAHDSHETLIRSAELVAMSLGHTDVDRAGPEVEAAVQAIEMAMKNRIKGALKAHVEVLIRYPFLDQARTTLADTLRYMEDEPTLLKTIKALGSVEEGDVLPQLLLALRAFKSKKKTALVKTVLEALGSVRGPRAVSVLLKFAGRGADDLSAAAIRSLGRYELHRPRVLKELVKLMDRAEKAGRKAHIKDRERWLVLKPAFQKALRTHTGEQFGSASEAKAWLKKKGR